MQSQFHQPKSIKEIQQHQEKYAKVEKRFTEKTSEVIFEWHQIFMEASKTESHQVSIPQPSEFLKSLKNNRIVAEEDQTYFEDIERIYYAEYLKIRNTPTNRETESKNQEPNFLTSILERFANKIGSLWPFSKAQSQLNSYSNLTNAKMIQELPFEMLEQLKAKDNRCEERNISEAYLIEVKQKIKEQKENQEFQMLG